MADGSVGIDEPEVADTDSYLDTEAVTFGAAPLLRHRERVRLAGEDATDLTEVTAGELHVNDADARTALASILGALAAPLAVAGTVALDGPSLAALEAVDLNAATLAALETINAVVSGTVALDGPTLAALESITASISNFPADYPDAAALAKAEAIRVLLAGTLSVAGSVAVSNFPAGFAVVGEVEVKNDSGSPVPVSGTVTADLGTIAGVATEVTLDDLRDRTPTQTGTWGYEAGVSGTPSLPANAKVLGITAHCTVAGSMTINAGDSIPIPALAAYVFTPMGNLVQPTIVFTGTDSFVIEYVV